MRTFYLTLAVLATSAALACGGGSGGGDPVGGGSTSTSLAADFTPDQPSPAAGSVAMAEGAGSGGDQIDLLVDAVDVNGVFGASFDVIYDPARLMFVNWSAGSALEAGGASVSYQVSAVTAGRLVVGISRTGGQATNVVGTRPLIHLYIRARQPGSHSVDFSAASLLDGQAPPQEIAGISWSGGTVTAN